MTDRIEITQADRALLAVLNCTVRDEDMLTALARHRIEARQQAFEEAAGIAECYEDPSLVDNRDVNVAAASARACIDIAANIRTAAQKDTRIDG